MPQPTSHPRLRPLELAPLPQAPGRPRRWLLSDPAGHLDAPLELSGAAVLLLSLCDGTRDRDRIRADYAAHARATLEPAELDEFLATMERHLLLDSPRFAQRLVELEAQWRALEWRPAAHSGGAYAADPGQLARALEEWLAAAPRAEPPPGRLVALVAPHIDYHRGGAGYGASYVRLRDFEPPEVVVLLGTGHAAAQGRYIVAAKGFETPLGRLPLDAEFLARLERRLPRDHRRGELVHRHEHSLELQAVWLAHLFAPAPPRIVPILAAGLDDLMGEGGGPLRDEEARGFLVALRDTLAEETRRTLVVVGADFAHVGPRFGDDAPLDEARLRDVAERDAAALDALVAGSAQRFFEAVARHANRDRICSVASLHAALFAAGSSRGERLHYAQAVDPAGQLAVTFAGAALYGDDEGRGLARRTVPAGRVGSGREA